MLLFSQDSKTQQEEGMRTRKENTIEPSLTGDRTINIDN